MLRAVCPGFRIGDMLPVTQAAIGQLDAARHDRSDLGLVLGPVLQAICQPIREKRCSCLRRLCR